MHDLFRPSNVANMKCFFEGKGYNLRNMYSQPTTQLQGTRVFIASNNLPDLSTDESPSAVRDWVALRCRSSFVEATHGFPDRGGKAFPLQAPELAHYLQHLQAKYDQQEFVEPLETKPSKPLVLTQAPMLGKRRAQVPAID